MKVVPNTDVKKRKEKKKDNCGLLLQVTAELLK